jgi:hypothetical protein
MPGIATKTIIDSFYILSQSFICFSTNPSARYIPLLYINM